ncbi:MAG: lasso peptide biosynthesis B2 protein [Actinomycetota bacterium]
MTIHAVLDQIWKLSPALRSVAFDDGAVLLDLRTGRFHLVNRGAAQVLASLETGAGPLTAARDLDPTRAVNRVHRELAGFLAALHRQGIVVPAGAADGNGARAFSSGAKPQQVPAAATPARRNLALEDAERARLSSFDQVGGAVAVAVAFGLLRCCSLRNIERALLRIKAQCRHEVDAREALTAWAATRRPRLFVFGRIACLETSLAATLFSLSRGRRGIDWCIGVATHPFVVHAWSEQASQPLGEQVSSSFRTILRV